MVCTNAAGLIELGKINIFITLLFYISVVPIILIVLIRHNNAAIKVSINPKIKM